MISSVDLRTLLDHLITTPPIQGSLGLYSVDRFLHCLRPVLRDLLPCGVADAAGTFLYLLQRPLYDPELPHELPVEGSVQFFG